MGRKLQRVWNQVRPAHPRKRCLSKINYNHQSCRMFKTDSSHMGDQPLSPKIGYGGLFIREWHRFEKLCISSDLELGTDFKYLCQFLKFIFKSIDIIPIKLPQCHFWRISMHYPVVMKLAQTITITLPSWWSSRTSPGGEQDRGQDHLVPLHRL